MKEAREQICGVTVLQAGTACPEVCSRKVRVVQGTAKRPAQLERGVRGRVEDGSGQAQGPGGDCDPGCPGSVGLF